ncbi:hypothetical protein ACIGXM_13980 [Kitasatospora sp. NPDC052896]|uniref:hypothetical protein n=1 Tax=Kitasatospora sp. NPDC052896 TaxID=3364061 RepID=UPI0037CAE038
MELEADDAGLYKDVADPEAGIVRLCSKLCSTCILRPGNLMDLEPGRVASMIREAREKEGHVVCHKTLGTPAPAICRGYADHADHGRSLALRFGRALNAIVEIEPDEVEKSSKRGAP